MDTDQFQESVKVQRFCLTLVGEARLWYESQDLLMLIGKAYKISSDNNF